MTNEGRVKSGQLIAGLIVLGVGVLMLIEGLWDYPARSFYRLWPLILIGIGASRLVGGDTEKRSSGLVLTGIGVWALISSLELFGLDWGDSWPLLLVFIGFARLACPDEGRRSAGLLMMLIGGWAFVNVQGYWGLYWESSWPIAVIIVGVFIVWKALFENGRKAPKEVTGNGES